MVYTPNPGFVGTDTFTFRANDGESNSNIATNTIHVARSVETQVVPAGGGTVSTGTSASPTAPVVTGVTCRRARAVAP